MGQPLAREFEPSKGPINLVDKDMEAGVIVILAGGTAMLVVIVAAVQMATKRIEDTKKPEETITHNLDMNNMLLLIDYAYTMGRRPLAG